MGDSYEAIRFAYWGTSILRRLKKDKGIAEGLIWLDEGPSAPG